MFENFYNAVWDALISFFKWVISIFASMIDAVLGAIFAHFPTLETSLDPVLGLIAGINYFFPLTYGLMLFSVYLTIKSTVILIKWVMKFIPTIG